MPNAEPACAYCKLYGLLVSRKFKPLPGRVRTPWWTNFWMATTNGFVRLKIKLNQSTSASTLSYTLYWYVYIWFFICFLGKMFLLIKTVYSKCLSCCFAWFLLCLFLYGLFCHCMVPLNLALSTLFATFYTLNIFSVFFKYYNNFA